MATRPYFGDPHCGDQCSYWRSGGKVTLCVVDGLGHGPSAEIAAKAAIAYVRSHVSEPLSDIFAGCNLALRSTRGAVMGIAVIDQEAATLTFAGVGNIAIHIIGEGAGHAASDAGIVGGGYRRMTPQTVALKPGYLVVMFTDGITERFDVSGYDGSVLSDMQKLADKIVEDWGRETDDNGVLILRYENS